jgi:hypothetical protein
LYDSFFAAYHGARKTLRVFVPLSPEMNIAVAGLFSCTPIAIVPTLRPMFPFALVMIGLDAYNGLNDV